MRAFFTSSLKFRESSEACPIHSPSLKATRSHPSFLPISTRSNQSFEAITRTMRSSLLTLMAIVAATATAAASLSYPDTAALLRRQAPGTPQYDCHANCGM